MIFIRHDQFHRPGFAFPASPEWPSEQADEGNGKQEGQQHRPLVGRKKLEVFDSDFEHQSRNCFPVRWRKMVSRLTFLMSIWDTSAPASLHFRISFERSF